MIVAVTRETWFDGKEIFSKEFEFIVVMGIAVECKSVNTGTGGAGIDHETIFFGGFV